MIEKMHEKQPFAQELISKLGTPRDSAGTGHVVMGLLLGLCIIGYLAFEYGLGQIMIRLCRRIVGGGSR